MPVLGRIKKRRYRRTFIVIYNAIDVPSDHDLPPNKAGVSPPAKAGRMG